jgi:glycosyltransferase involved in cell wall biosynthesis
VSFLNLSGVALISEEFPPFTFGGIGSVCHDLAYALSRNGVSTAVFCGKAERVTLEKVNKNLKIVRLPCLDFPPRFLWFQLQNFKLLSKLLKDYAVLHIVNPEAGATTAYVGRRLNKPVVMSVHGTYVYPIKKMLSSPFSSWTFGDVGTQLLGYPLHRFLYGRCLKHSNRVAVCSASTLGELKSIYPNLALGKATVIPNGVDFNQFSSTASSYKERNPSIIFYGRLLWAKGVQFLIEAVAELRKDFPNLQVRIFGDGPFKEKTNRLVSDFGLNKNISVRGYVPRATLFQEIEKASIVVLPSLHEAQPISFLEAMACRKPVVAFDFPFSREIIHDMHTGLLARPGDVQDLSGKIKVLLEDEELRSRIGKNAYEYVKREHNWNTLAEKYVELYSEAETDLRCEER